MIFSAHVKTAGTVTSFFKQPLVDIEFDTPELQGTCSFESVMNDKSKGVVENSIIIFLR
jgi:hypothetical protein